MKCSSCTVRDTKTRDLLRFYSSSIRQLPLLELDENGNASAGISNTSRELNAVTMERLARLKSKGVQKNNRMGILTFPTGGAALIPLANLVDLLSHISEEVFLISGPEAAQFFGEDARVRPVRVNHIPGTTSPSRILRYIFTQIKLAFGLAEASRMVDTWVFFIGGDLLIVPLLAAKALKRRVILVLAGSASQSLRAANDRLSRPTELLSSLNCSLSDRIVVYSDGLVREWNLERYQKKVVIAQHNLVDFGRFKVTAVFENRETRVGFIGRMGYEKGALEFAQAIPEILAQRKDVEFVMAGDGILRKRVEEFIRESNLQDAVELEGWIAHDEVPHCLNYLKLLVVPSSTEGLPNIILEAMACGTPVLATPVGSIADLIADGQTGFLMDDNSPQCIAGNVIRALSSPDLETVANKARDYVLSKFDPGVIMKGWNLAIGEDSNER